MLWNRDIKNATSSYVGFVSADYLIPLIRYYGKKKEIETAIRFFSGHLKQKSLILIYLFFHFSVDPDPE